MDEPPTIYSRSGCVQCVATLRALDAAGIAYRVVDLAADAEALRRVRAMGFQQAPVVDAAGQSWSGFRPDKIDELAAQRQLDRRG